MVNSWCSGRSNRNQQQTLWWHNTYPCAYRLWILGADCHLDKASAFSCCLGWQRQSSQKCPIFPRNQKKQMSMQQIQRFTSESNNQCVGPIRLTPMVNCSSGFRLYYVYWPECSAPERRWFDFYKFFYLQG